MAQALTQWAIEKQREFNEWIDEKDPHVKATKKAAWERALWESHPGKPVKAKEQHG